jgi:hypothetical protein
MFHAIGIVTIFGNHFAISGRYWVGLKERYGVTKNDRLSHETDMYHQ